MDDTATITVQVCYACPNDITLLSLTIRADMPILDAIKVSGLIEQHPDIDLSACKFGVFGKVKSPDAKLHQGDRIEVYRPLTVDPMEARRRRALKQKRL